MEKQFYSIFDKKLERFNLPGLEEGDREIMVSLSRAIKDKSSFLYLNRNDLALYHVGTFDDKTGTIAPQNPPRLVCDIYSLSEEM